MHRNSNFVSKKTFTSTNSTMKLVRTVFKSESSSLSSNGSSPQQSEEDIRERKTKFVAERERKNPAKNLRDEVRQLRRRVKRLEECVENKDFSIGIVTEEKDRAVGETRRLERNNKQLKQQLNDERSHYLEEKEMFCAEMTKYKKRLQQLKIKTENADKASTLSQRKATDEIKIFQSKFPTGNERGDSEERCPPLRDRRAVPKDPVVSGGREKSHDRKSNPMENFRMYEGEDLSLQMVALRTENAKLRSIISERDERNYELCLRFLRMKHCKNELMTRFQDLENEYLQVISNLMEKIDEARQEFNFIIDQKFKRPLHSNNAAFLQLVQRNSKMAFENASLRLELQALKKELNQKVRDALGTERKSKGKPVASEKNANKTKKQKKNVIFSGKVDECKISTPYFTSDTNWNSLQRNPTADLNSATSAILKEKSDERTTVMTTTTTSTTQDESVAAKKPIEYGGRNKVLDACGLYGTSSCDLKWKNGEYLVKGRKHETRDIKALRPEKAVYCRPEKQGPVFLKKEAETQCGGICQDDKYYSVNESVNYLSVHSSCSEGYECDKSYYHDSVQLADERCDDCGLKRNVTSEDWGPSTDSYSMYTEVRVQNYNSELQKVLEALKCSGVTMGWLL